MPKYLYIIKIVILYILIFFSYITTKYLWKGKKK